MALLEIKALSFKYGGAKQNAIENIDLSVEQGDFVLICGESGCGKTTLLRMLKKQIRPFGEMTGEILMNGIPVDEMSDKESVFEIGYVMQDPEAQTVCDSVRHELAFGLESLGEKSDVIMRRVAEICGFFGIGEWFGKKTSELSGGQKQLLALASVMVTDPSVLILDEPTAQLDPIAASDFLSALYKLNRELGVTIIIAEHRLEEVFHMASKVLVIERSRMSLCDTPRNIGRAMFGATPHKMSIALPASVRVFSALGGEGEAPLTVNEGKRYIAENFADDIKELDAQIPNFEAREKVIELSGGYFRYERDMPDVLSGIDLDVYDNELLCIVGANGAGKTTLIKVLSGVKRLYKGKYRLRGKKLSAYASYELYKGNIACMPQDPKTLFVRSTLNDDLIEAALITNEKREYAQKKVDDVAERLGISHLLGSHPHDLSGGERQKAALAKLLMTEPSVIMLDEPTKGLDACSKRTFAEILCSLKSEGKTIIIVTHDVEFAAEHADRCAMFFDGRIVSCADRISFFADNRYYTTAAARMTAPKFKNAVTVDMAIEICKLNGKLSTERN